MAELQLQAQREGWRKHRERDANKPGKGAKQRCNGGARTAWEATVKMVSLRKGWQASTGKGTARERWESSSGCGDHGERRKRSEVQVKPWQP